MCSFLFLLLLLQLQLMLLLLLLLFLMLFRYPLRFILGSLRWKLSFGQCGVWWDGGLWWAVLVCRPIFMSNPTQLSWKGHLPCTVRQDVYYLSHFCPFGRQKVEKAPSWLHLWLAFSTNAQNSKIREVVTAPFKIDVRTATPYITSTRIVHRCVRFEHYQICINSALHNCN